MAFAPGSLIWMLGCSNGTRADVTQEGPPVVGVDVPSTEELRSLRTLAYGGDTLLGRDLNRIAEKQGFDYPLGELPKPFSEAAVAVVNLECVLSARGKPNLHEECKRPYLLRGRPENVRALAAVGIDVVNVANNHAGDYGKSGLLEGVETLRRAGITPVGGGENLDRAMAPAYVRAGGTVVAVIGLETRHRRFTATDAAPGINYIHQLEVVEAVGRVRRQVADARRYAHLVFLTVHWGGNWEREPNDKQYALGRALAKESGVDGILGSGPHLSQGLQVVDGRPVVWGPGNLLWDSVERSRETSAMVRLYFDKGGVRWVELLPLKMERGRSSLARGEKAHRFLERIQERTRVLGTALVIHEGRGWIRVDGDRDIREPREALPETPAVSPTFPGTGADAPRPVVLSSLPPGITPHRVAFENGIELLGCAVPRQVEKGSGFLVKTYWTASAPVPESFTIKLSAEPVVADISPWSARGHEPGDWTYPTNRWRPGEIIEDEVFVRATGSEAGSYQLRVKLMNGNEVLQVSRPDQHDGKHRVRLGTVQISEGPE